MLTQFHDTLRVSIVYQHLVQELIRGYTSIAQDAGLRRVSRRGDNIGVRVRAALRTSRRCPACQIVQAEERTLAALLVRLDDKEVRCFPRGRVCAVPAPPDQGRCARPAQPADAAVGRGDRGDARDASWPTGRVYPQAGSLPR